MELPCTTIANYEASPFVFWRGLTLQSEKRTHSVSDENGKKVNEKVYEPASSFITNFFDTLVKMLEKYFPNDDLFKVATALNQKRWPYDVNKIKTIPSIMEGLQKWPKVLGLENEIPDMTEDIDHLIYILKGKELKWCERHQSDSTNFWNLLLVQGVLTPNLEKLVERTLTIPYGRYILNCIKVDEI